MSPRIRPMRRVGVFGGTFDPPHLGHISTALEACHALGLDELLMVVAGDPWQKTEQQAITSAFHRSAMAELAFAPHDALTISNIEIQRDGPSYMAETLADLAGSDHELLLIVGSDAAAGLDTWHRPEAVKALASVIVVEREGYANERPPAGWDHQVVEVPGLEISSRDIRRRVACGEPIAGLVPGPVAHYIETHGLYRPMP